MMRYWLLGVIWVSAWGYDLQLSPNHAVSFKASSTERSGTPTQFYKAGIEKPHMLHIATGRIVVSFGSCAYNKTLIEDEWKLRPLNEINSLYNTQLFLNTSALNDAALAEMIAKTYPCPLRYVVPDWKKVRNYP